MLANPSQEEREAMGELKLQKQEKKEQQEAKRKEARLAAINKY